jgi:hypothetical protein
MKNTISLFPGFHLETLRRKPRSSQQKLADEMIVLKQKSFAQLGECFGRFIPTEYLRPTQAGAHSRRRLFSRENTFWAFLSQVFDQDGGCRCAVSVSREPSKRSVSGSPAWIELKTTGGNGAGAFG